MKIVRPLVITDLNLTSSNITSPETGAPVYVPATVYALGDRVTQELATSTVTITNAAPAVITWVAHELPVGALVSFTTSGSLPTGIVAGTQYVVKSVTADTFKIARANLINDRGALVCTSTAGSGTHTISVHIHKTYVSLQAANTGNTPRKASSSAWWQEEGASNKWAAFDGSITSQSTGVYVEYIITLSSAVYADTLALLNISGTSVTVICTESAVVTYTSTQSLITSTWVNNTATASPYAVKERLQNVVFTDLPIMTAGGTVKVTLTTASPYPYELCAIGGVILGRAVTIASGTEYGASMGIQDYSVIEENDFGNFTIVERTFSKQASFTMHCLGTEAAMIFELLARLRATPCLYIGSGTYTPTVIYGFPSDWSIVIQYPTYSVLNIDIKGLT